MTPATLLDLGTATLHEASGLECCLDPTIRPVWSGARMCGPALPIVTAPRDNLALHAALELAHPGEVLVVDAGGHAHGHWGEILAAAATHAGVVGLVIDGGVRDVGALERADFPTFASSICVRGTSKQSSGRIGDPAVIGGVRINRGDVVVADTDGVIVLPAGQLDRIIAHANERVVAESHLLERIAAGETTMDLYGLRQPPCQRSSRSTREARASLDDHDGTAP